MLNKIRFRLTASHCASWPSSFDWLTDRPTDQQIVQRNDENILQWFIGKYYTQFANCICSPTAYQAIAAWESNLTNRSSSRFHKGVCHHWTCLSTTTDWGIRPLRVYLSFLVATLKPSSPQKSDPVMGLGGSSNRGRWTFPRQTAINRALDIYGPAIFPSIEKAHNTVENEGAVKGRLTALGKG